MSEGELRCCPTHKKRGFMNKAFWRYYDLVNTYSWSYSVLFFFFLLRTHAQSQLSINKELLVGDKCCCIYWDHFGSDCSYNPDLWWQFKWGALRPTIHLQRQDFLLLHHRRATGWTSLVQHNFQLWARPEIFFLYRSYWWVSQGKNKTMRKPHFSCPIFTSQQASHLFWGYIWEVSLLCNLDPGDMELTSQLKILPSFPVILRNDTKGKALQCICFWHTGIVMWLKIFIW